MFRFLLTSAIALSAFAAAADPLATAETYVRAVAADDIPAVRSLFVSDDNVTATVDVLERHDCMVVERHRFTVVEESADRVRLQLDWIVHGRVTGLSRAEMVQPTWTWDLELTRQGEVWRIARADPRERAIAAEMLAAPSDDDRRRILERHRGADWPRVLRFVAWSAADAVEHADALAFALSFAREMQHVETELYVMRLVALAHAQRRDPAATALAQAALDEARRRGTPADVVHGLHFSGLTAWFLGDPTAARAAFRRAGAMVAEVDEPRAALRALHMDGVLAIDQADLYGAIAAAEKELALAEQYSWEEGVSNATSMLGSVYASMRQPKAALPMFLRARDLALRQHNRLYAAYALRQAASALHDLGDREGAIRTARETLALSIGMGDDTSVADTRAFLADLLASAGRHAEAEAVLREALPEGEPLRWWHTNVLLARGGLRHTQGRYAEALADAELARDAIASGDTLVLRQTASWRPDVLAGRVLRRLGRGDEARAMFASAVARIEEQRETTPPDLIVRAQYLRDKTVAFDELATLLVERGEPREALLVVNRARGRVLHDVLVAGRADLSRSMTAAERQREEELDAALAAANERVLAAAGDAKQLAARDAARIALARYRAELYLHHPELRLRRVADPLQALADPRALLPREDGVVLVYAVQSDATLAFALTRRGDALDIAVKRIAAGRDELTARVTTFARGIEQRDLTYATQARALHRLLLEPFAPQLAGKSVLCIVPDGPLWQLPFAALQSASKKHVVESMAVFFTPSLSLLRDARPPAHATPSLLALGDPARRTAPLPDAGTEVRRIAALYPRASVLTGARASEAALKKEAGHHSIVHLATHGSIDDASPLYSSLLLADTEGEDGLLEMREILDLPLSADLVVLSACETARGTMHAGEGLVGMAWALMAAGARNTVVTQWKVASHSTSRLMIDFHEHLVASHEHSPAIALRAAQAALRKDERFRHPFYWAPFTVTGGSW